jgi:hypothetical protein
MYNQYRGVEFGATDEETAHKTGQLKSSTDIG